MTTPQYEALLDSITDDDCRKAFDFMLDRGAIGADNRLTIEAISFQLYKAVGDNAIRKTRDVLEILRTEYRVPICSTSGKPGRWLAASEDEKRECLADFYARRDSLSKVINALERAPVPAAKELSKPAQAEQLGFAL